MQYLYCWVGISSAVFTTVMPLKFRHTGYLLGLRGESLYESQWHEHAQENQNQRFGLNVKGRGHKQLIF